MPVDGSEDQPARVKRGVITMRCLSEAPGINLRRGHRILDPVARHWHDEYQLCLIEAGGGELRYRGAAHATPPDSLFVLAPGEIHANETREADGCSFRSLYLDPELLARAAAEVGAADPLPQFPHPLIFDPDLVSAYRHAHRAMEAAAPRLEYESALLEALVMLVSRHASEPGAMPRAGSERPAVRGAREYLIDHFRDPVSLATLAAVAGLSPFHLNRVFRRELGMPPHSYQIQLRVHYARRLIQGGQPISLAARMAGFGDQSHLARHFRRLLGVPPAAYARRRRKNVQDRVQAHT